MAVIDVEVRSQSPYANNESIGDYGTFERIDGVLHYAVDPNDVHNSNIVDIDLASKDPAGKVRFSGDFTLIAPTHQTPRALLLEVPNRGNRLSFRMFNRANMEDLLRDPCAIGDGFIFQHGFALLSVGWQFDALGMKLHVPDATKDGCPLQGDVICRMQPSRPTKSMFVGQLGPASYRLNQETADLARLYEQAHPNAAKVVLNPSSWSFGRINNKELEPSDEHISSHHGFSAGRLYTLIYNACGAPVVGLGLLALRDAGAFFRSGKYPGRTAPPKCVIAFGASQTGRVLRHMLYEGLYVNEEDDLVLDGVMPHIAGAQRGDFNHRFAQPSSVGVPACGQLFPFAGRTTADLLTDQRGGLFRNNRDLPRVFQTNTSWEYWRGDAALAHVSTGGDIDIEPEPQERIYLFAGTHHINAVLPVSHKLAHSGDRVRYPMNTVSYTPLIRAALLNLLEWIEGTSIPPLSQIPRVADGTLVDRKTVIGKFENARGIDRLPDITAMPRLHVMDLGPRVSQGICDFPAKEIQGYPALVCDVGDDLNENAGIRLPDLAVPLGVHTGWNLRHVDDGGSDQLATFAGFSLFDKTLISRKTKSMYLKNVQASIDQLVEGRFILEEDRNLLRQGAQIRYDLAERNAI